MKRPVILLFCALGLVLGADPALAREGHGSRRVERQAHHTRANHPPARAATHRAAARHLGERRAARRMARHHSRPAGRHALARHIPAHQVPAGRGQRGHASVYARSLAGHRMADGTRFNPHAAVVASRTLPLGSRARVTNLRNGRSMVVEVRDRGPHHGGRIVDLSPGVASRLGMAGGVAPVEIMPITLASRAEAAAPRHR